MGTFITFPELLIWFPVLSGILCFFFTKQDKVKAWALLSSIITFCIAIAAWMYADTKAYNEVSYYWLRSLGSSFHVGMGGMERLLTLLTALAFPVIFISSYNNNYKDSPVFYGLMLLAQAGLMGVFVAKDMLVFYFFWELALIPVYFLSSRWGGEKRISASFKFFVYTLIGSLIMLIGIIYMYQLTPGFTNKETGDVIKHSFSYQNFLAVDLDPKTQGWLFWLFFVAFAIKMPIFPLHTWQPDAYEHSPTPVTMVLSGVMVKMGLFAVIKFMLPFFPLALQEGSKGMPHSNIVIGLSVFGMIYASCIAILQDDLKRLVAYSSIAHIGLMCAAIFTKTEMGVQGAIVQMFNHGINIIGLWIVVELIERKTGTRKISQLSGIAHKAPVLAIMLVVIALANIALPLTNAFAGEFLMFSGLFQWNKWYAAFAGISIILAAIYTLNMIKNVFYGEVNERTSGITDINLHEKIILGMLVFFILLMGVYPQPLLDMVKDTVETTLNSIK